MLPGIIHHPDALSQGNVRRWQARHSCPVGRLCHLEVRRDAAGVRLFTRNGHDWTGRFPLIARAALSLKGASYLIDGEAVA